MVNKTQKVGGIFVRNVCTHVQNSKASFPNLLSSRDPQILYEAVNITPKYVSKGWQNWTHVGLWKLTKYWQKLKFHHNSYKN